MRKLTMELKELFDESAKFASYADLCCVGLWDVFCPKKRDKLIECLKNGMSWKFAFENAKNLK
jgi:hypothetical protein